MRQEAFSREGAAPGAGEQADTARREATARVSLQGSLAGGGQRLPVGAWRLREGALEATAEHGGRGEARLLGDLLYLQVG